MSDLLRRVADAALDHSRGQVSGRPVVLVAPVLAGATTRAELLHQLGAEKILVVTFGDGTGPLPPPGSVEVVRAPHAEIRDVSDEIRAWSSLLLTPHADVVAAVDAFDPEHRAVVRTAVPVASDGSFAGRPVINGRLLEQERLEDKAICGEIFAAAGVDVAPEVVVQARETDLRRAVADLDEGMGVVVSSDASHGMNGGATKVWWVRSAERLDDVLTKIVAGGDRARVMPFLEGQPCSIHGIVSADGVIVLRPVELAMLRPAGGIGFVQGGASTWWDPTPQVREQMRSAARKVGELLSRRYDYRGAFGIDGIATADGFRPHELNPRYSAGINTIGKGLTDLSLGELSDLLQTGGTIPAAPDDIERVVVETADEHRFASAHLGTQHVRPDSTSVVLVTGSPDSLAVTEDEDAAVGTLELGPASVGGLVRFTPFSLQRGERLTPWAVAAYRLADELWDTQFGEFEQPADLR